MIESSKIVPQVSIDTPTVSALKSQRAAPKDYWFFLQSRDAEAVAALGDAALVAYAVIRAAAFGPRSGQWVTVRQKVSESLGRGYRWWHAATSRLEEAGLLEVQRQRGRAPRYRLPPSRAVPPSQQ